MGREYGRVFSSNPDVGVNGLIPKIPKKEAAPNSITICDFIMWVQIFVDIIL